MTLGVDLQAISCLVERAFVFDAGKSIEYLAVVWRRIADTVAGEKWQPEFSCQVSDQPGVRARSPVVWLARRPSWCRVLEGKLDAQNVLVAALADQVDRICFAADSAWAQWAKTVRADQ
jgi:hypothetical protein